MDKRLPIWIQALTIIAISAMLWELVWWVRSVDARGSEVVDVILHWTLPMLIGYLCVRLIWSLLRDSAAGWQELLGFVALLVALSAILLQPAVQRNRGEGRPMVYQAFD